MLQLSSLGAAMRAMTAWKIVMAVACMAACSSVAAQAVYRCGFRSYSSQPCSKHVVNTADAPVPVTRADVRAREQRRLLAQSLRREPGESAADFGKRRRWTRLLPADGQECARLDKRMPLEEARMASPDQDEIDAGKTALAGARKRARELHC
jgi:hypothetical protein